MKKYIKLTVSDLTEMLRECDRRDCYIEKLICLDNIADIIHRAVKNSLVELVKSKFCRGERDGKCGRGED